MKHHKLYEGLHGGHDRAEEDGSLTHGQLMVGEDGIVRFVTHEQRQRMSGLALPSGHGGYPVLDDAWDDKHE